MKMLKEAKKWRESASLIILAKDNLQSKTFKDANYKVLLFNRSEKSSFMPSFSVFPGGMHEIADESLLWLKHFQDFGIKQEELNKLILTRSSEICPQPTIFQTEKGERMHKDISLRITAIRETFEEMGILICRDRKSYSESVANKFSSFYEDFDRKYWQHLVHNNAEEFLKMCQQLDVVPDLWNINEWSVWLTPVAYKKRFETAFYLASLQCLPNVILEENEAVDYKWISPKEALLLNLKGDIWLPPPQFYELTRLLSFDDLAELQTFAVQRARFGSILMLPVQLQCSNGIVGLLPGDSHYPSDPNSATVLNDMGVSLLDFRAKAKKLHRLEMSKFTDNVLLLNFDPIDGHKRLRTVKPLANL